MSHDRKSVAFATPLESSRVVIDRDQRLQVQPRFGGVPDNVADDSTNNSTVPRPERPEEEDDDESGRSLGRALAGSRGVV